MGVESEVCSALVNSRRGIGVELKPSYYQQSKKNIAAILNHGWGDGTSTESLIFDPEPDPPAENESTI